MRTVAAVPLGNDSSLLVKQVKYLALGGGHTPTAVALAKAAGAPTRVIDAILQCKTVDLYTRAAVPALATSDSDLAALHNARNIATSFIPLLKNQSVFYRGIDANLTVQVPLRTRLSSLILGATSFIVGEGAAVPISIVKLDGQVLEAIKACGIFTLTNEMKRSMGGVGSAADNFLTRMIQRSIAQPVDEEFFDRMFDSDTPVGVSVGNDIEDATQDLKTLLTAVGPTAESKLLFAMAPDVAINAATLFGTGGQVFPGMTPSGGTLLGQPAMVTDGLAPGELVLLDFAGIVGAADTIAVDVSSETSLEMSDAPSADVTTPTETTTVSLFQTDAVAVKCLAVFGCARLRSNAVAKLTSVDWGGEPVTI